HEYLCCHLETSIVGHTLDSVSVGVRLMAGVPQNLYVRLENQENIAMLSICCGRWGARRKRSRKKEDTTTTVNKIRKCQLKTRT
ncbi:MAG: hypothetical protein ACYTFQ_32440, partial [Planctomycetota bacterium]